MLKLLQRIDVDLGPEKSSYRLFSPSDPYGIFRRLAEIYLSARFNTDTQVVDFIELKEPIPLFDEVFTVGRWATDIIRDPKNIHFTKWWYQEIPKAFWYYNVYIDLYRKTLYDSAAKSSLQEVWTDMPNVKNKLKTSILTDGQTLPMLKAGKLIMPSYEEIEKGVASWSYRALSNSEFKYVQKNCGYTYAFGNVKEPEISVY